MRREIARLLPLVGETDFDADMAVLGKCEGLGAIGGANWFVLGLVYLGGEGGTRN